MAEQKGKLEKNGVPNDLLGPMEYMVIRAVMELRKEEAYGMAVYEAIQSVYPPVSFGSVYTALDRLRWRGYLESELGQPAPMRGGRGKNYFRVTELGKKMKEATLEMFTAPMSRNNRDEKSAKKPVRQNRYKGPPRKPPHP